MKRRKVYIVFLVLATATMFVRFAVSGPSQSDLNNATPASDKIVIFPDYSNTVIPPNIAPLNFRIEIKGDAYYIRIHSSLGKAIEIFSPKPEVYIPQRKWRNLLELNRGNELQFDIYVKESNQWRRYDSFKNTIANDKIDSHLAYRLLLPQYNYFKNLGVYQRDLESFDESLILHGRYFKNGCVNCHNFSENDPSRMLLGIRSGDFGSGTLHVNGDNVTKIGTTFGHTAWHPSGKLAVYSIYDVRMFYHTLRQEVKDVIEFDSLLGYYMINEQKTGTIPALSDKHQLETQPTWSPDGKYLYFVSSPKLWSTPKFPPDRFAEVKYDLKRISYDAETDKWGQLETVLSAKDTGLSILTPRFSPDGRFVALVMCNYSCFALYQPDSDLYMLDLNTGKYEKLSCNSEFADSWHSWSTNGRWMVFSSKRDTGIFTRLFITYIDEEGKSRKPFILPQKKPEFYESYLNLYNVPELITGPVKISTGSLVRAVRGSNRIEVDSVTKATPQKNDGGGDRWQKRFE